MAGNHKFFNAFLIIGNMYSAFLLIKLWGKFKLFRPVVIITIFFLIFSGIIDFFPIKNDGFMTVSDYPKNPDIQWIIKNTPKDAVFLNSTYLYNPASLAGRKIFMGWPYFSWSLGYDTYRRGNEMKQILGVTEKQTACKLLKQKKINYVEIQLQEPPDSDIPIISDIYRKEFHEIYSDTVKNYSIYDVSKNCLYERL